MIAEQRIKVVFTDRFHSVFVFVSSANDIINKDWPATYPLYVDLRQSPPHVWWSIHGRMTLRCSLDMAWFPFDEQKCNLQISTISSPIESIYLKPGTGLTNLMRRIDSGEFWMAITRYNVEVGNVK